ncbi:MAG: thioredoxin reductase [Pseudomonadota bacterium]|jgi:thioredoxin reductase (NADPH)
MVDLSATGAAEGDALDTLVVGGGPGGLTAALYLSRYRRTVRVLDRGDGRCAWIPRSHNLPGWPDGLPGPELLDRLRRQAARYGALLTAAEVAAVSRRDGLFLAWDAAGTVWSARTLVLATGVEDMEPALPDLLDAVRRGLVRHCPICDGWEAGDSRIGVLGHGRHGALEALFLRSFSADVTLILAGAPGEGGGGAGVDSLDADLRRDLADAGIRVEGRGVGAVRVVGDRIAALTVGGPDGGGEVLSFDTLYSALGSRPRNDFARALGADLAGDGRVLVDNHARTAIPGLYAIGDLTPGLNQIACAEADGARAATHIHNSLHRWGVAGDLTEGQIGMR